MFMCKNQQNHFLSVQVLKPYKCVFTMHLEFQKLRYGDCVGHGIVVFINICVLVNCHMFDLNSRFVSWLVICFRKQMCLFVVGNVLLVDYKHFLTTFNQAMSCSSIFS